MEKYPFLKLVLEEGISSRQRGTEARNEAAKEMAWAERKFPVQHHNNGRYLRCTYIVPRCIVAVSHLILSIISRIALGIFKVPSENERTEGNWP